MSDDSRPGRSLHTWILIGLVVGVLLGMVGNFARDAWPQTAGPAVATAERIATPLGKVFLRIVIMVVVPLVFSALVMGVMEIGDVASLGRIGLRTLAVTGVFSVAAALIGIALVNVIKPGVGLDQKQIESLTTQYADKAKKAVAQAEQAQTKTLEDRLLDMLPANLLLEAVGAVDGSSPGNGMLALMTYSLFFGIALSQVGAKGKPLANMLEAVFAVCMKIIGYAMAIAPFAVACLMFSVTVSVGASFLGNLAKFVATVTLGLAIQFFVVYPLALWLIARRSPWAFFRDANEVIATAFATSSSNATLPVSLRVAKEDLRIRPKISQFVLTVGATGNQNGTALYEGVVVLFLAQVFGKSLGYDEQATVVLMAVLASIGTAGVPGGSLPLIVGVLQSVKVPGGSIALILGVDRFLDMLRTVLNVVGDLVVAACVAGLEPPEPEEESGPQETQGAPEPSPDAPVVSP